MTRRLPRRHLRARRAPEQSQESRSRDSAERARRRDGRVGLGQILAGVRHAVCGRAAALRRDVLALRAAVPRSHGQAAGGSHRGHSAGHRDRSDQSGAHVALHRRHDDGAQRSSEAAVCARARRCSASAAASRCGGIRRRASTRTCARARAAAGDPRLLLCFPVPVPKNFKESEVRELLEKQGYTRFFEPAKPSGGPRDAQSAGHSRQGRRAQRVREMPKCATSSKVVQDRFRVGSAERGRVLESLEAALRVGRGRVNVHVVDDATRRAASTAGATRTSCTAPIAICRIASRSRACSRSIRRWARAKPAAASAAPSASTTASSFRTRASRCAAARSARGRRESYKECQDDLEKFAKKRGIPLDRPWRELSERTARVGHRGRRRVDARTSGTARSASSSGSRPSRTRCTCACCCRAIARTRRAKHATVRGSRPRRCCGASAAASSPIQCSILRSASGPPGVQWSDETLPSLPGLTIHDLMLLPLERACEFFRKLRAAASRWMKRRTCCSGEIRTRFSYLTDVGLGYLTLDRQSRTLSGGEVQRINLTTALGTSLVNTLFVLDEPSIGLHPRDMLRVIGVMKRLRDAGNSLVVVEHDPQIMLEADRILDHGPGRRRARRRGRVLRQSARDSAHDEVADRRVPERTQGRGSTPRRRRRRAHALRACRSRATEPSSPKRVRTDGSSCAARASTT